MKILITGNITPLKWPGEDLQAPARRRVRHLQKALEKTPGVTGVEIREVEDQQVRSWVEYIALVEYSGNRYPQPGERDPVLVISEPALAFGWVEDTSVKED